LLRAERRCAGTRLTAAELPAWLLLHESTLASHLGEALSTGTTPGEEHYRCVHRWVRTREAGRTEDEIALRKVLQSSQPVLLRYLKRVVAAEDGKQSERAA
jgi:hypothetical protein